MAFSNSDWASDVDDRRSTSGWCVLLGSTAMAWSSKKQNTVSRSNTEAEYRSLVSCVSKVLWLKTLLSKLKF